VGESPILTFRGLGEYGRLGNQLSQIAATIGVAERHGLEPRIETWAYREQFRLPDHLFGPVPADARDVRKFARHLPDAHRDFVQEYSLFGDSLERVRAWLMPADEQVRAARNRLGGLLERPSPTAVHVRRTDYVGDEQHHPPQPPVYYEEALARLPAAVTPIIFTDDPAWCRDALRHLRPAAILDPGPDVVDLAAMALCERHVIANSTYSYWGALLAGDERAVYPRRWFGPDFAEAEDIQRAPPTWIAVDPARDRTLRGRWLSQARWRRRLIPSRT
jgi:hypothetical protein